MRLCALLIFKNDSKTEEKLDDKYRLTFVRSSQVTIGAAKIKIPGEQAIKADFSNSESSSNSLHLENICQSVFWYGFTFWEVANNELSTNEENPLQIETGSKPKKRNNDFHLEWCNWFVWTHYFDKGGDCDINDVFVVCDLFSIISPCYSQLIYDPLP